MPNLPWREAIIQVLTSTAEPLHYTEIAEAIAERKLRTEVGATPAATVNSTISVSLQDEAEQSPFVRVGRGVYGLRTGTGESRLSATPAPDQDVDDTGLINAFGMYWARSSVVWTPAPKILGQQQPESTPVDFCGQRGVYLLHDGRAVVYVGRTTDQPLGLRLRQHSLDRLNSRWNRFSWFGVYPVTNTGALNTSAVGVFDLDMLIVTMEALLIEGLEPPQNRKRGDEFKAVEFLQVEDPSVQRKQILNLIDEIKNKL